MKKIVVHGMNGEMVVEGDKITVKHTAPLFLGKREIVLDVHSLQAVVYKKAHLLINGFLKLVPKEIILCFIKQLPYIRWEKTS